MNCEQKYCIYNNEGECLVETVKDVGMKIENSNFARMLR